jgi:hypothetical protein
MGFTRDMLGRRPYSKLSLKKGLQSDVAEYLESRLQVIRSIPPAETHVEFALDPLA